MRTSQSQRNRRLLAVSGHPTDFLGVVAVGWAFHIQVSTQRREDPVGAGPTLQVQYELVGQGGGLVEKFLRERPLLC